MWLSARVSGVKTSTGSTLQHKLQENVIEGVQVSHIKHLHPKPSEPKTLSPKSRKSLPW